MLKNLIIELKNIKERRGDIFKKIKSINLIVEKNKPFFYLIR